MSGLAFLERLPPDHRGTFVDDAKYLIGWATDAAAANMTPRVGQVVDRGSSFSSVPGFAAPTKVERLSARYRVLREPRETRGYYGVLLGLLDKVDQTRAVILVNRLFRLPVVLQEPIGVASDALTNAGLLLGFETGALGAACRLADIAYDLARQFDVPLIATGQSQAGGTAQLQIAAVAGQPGWHGFVTFNATCGARIIRRFGADPTRLQGVNFAKDLDPLVGPHTWLANRIGLQIYIHPDGSAGLAPGASFLHASLHPREHFLDSFNDLSLGAILETLEPSRDEANSPSSASD